MNSVGEKDYEEALILLCEASTLLVRKLRSMSKPRSEFVSALEMLLHAAELATLPEGNHEICPACGSPYSRPLGSTIQQCLSCDKTWGHPETETEIESWLIEKFSRP
ncbi:MAG: hypothetical protein C0617_00020 [Desulfuromonas sp.]|uniref:hypothetical protein n=1 Tax=Desulfuromonas sp. TaxID=892 RepID=UPI000CC607A0|nr:hypothetical protein [Desulfuromonas sp.]PLX86754.1 MAG: hypothetical protein C0617_00020 [Desulfuromonas sp.]